jgi:hypothetical protein
MSAQREIAGLLAAEEAGWAEIHHLVDSLPPVQAEAPGYFPEGWSVKDLIGHLGSWLAEAGIALERIQVGTYRLGELDIDAKNDEFLDALRTLTLRESHAMAEAARARMLRTLGSLPSVSEDASWWIHKAGPAHYDDHLPRLREWVGELRSGGRSVQWLSPRSIGERCRRGRRRGRGSNEPDRRYTGGTSITIRSACWPPRSQSRIASAALTTMATPPAASSRRSSGYRRRPGIRKTRGAVVMTPTARYRRNRTPAGDARKAFTSSAASSIRRRASMGWTLPATGLRYTPSHDEAGSSRAGTGTRPITVVPSPGVLRTSSDPRTASRRSAMPLQSGAVRR